MAELMDRFPAISDLEKRAKRRSPVYSWEYLASGTGDEASMHRNRDALLKVELSPQFLKGVIEPEITTTMFGVEHSAPIGAAPVGLSGLIWPGSDQALAAAAAKHRFPQVLSTVATAAPEVVRPIAGEYGWFQLYPPKETPMRDSLVDRVAELGYTTMVVTADVPAPSRRERQRKAQIRVPPKIGPRLVVQTALHPAWTMAMLRNGMPGFGTLETYVDSKSLAKISGFVGASLGGTLSWEYLAEVRERWSGNIVVKGILDPSDAQRCIDEGVDAVWVSNHGGRQLEAAPASIDTLAPIVEQVAKRVPVFFDSGVRSGADVARALALGADFVFCGRAFMFGLAALGPRGVAHAYEILVDGLLNVMHQTGATTIDELRERLVV